MLSVPVQKNTCWNGLEAEKSKKIKNKNPKKLEVFATSITTFFIRCINSSSDGAPKVIFLVNAVTERKNNVYWLNYS